MKMQLSIFDVSAYIYNGMSVDTFKGYKNQGMPLGGMKYFIRYLTSELARGRDVICAFDSKSFRKDIYKGYKKGRVGRPEIYAQTDLLYNTLSKCGVACYKVDGAEGDDIIYNAVKQNKSEYIRVAIYGVDYDLAHNVDEGTVVFESVNSNANNVSATNFRTAIAKGEYVYFNTISAFKALTGCASDKIPPFRSVKGYSGMEIYNMFVNVLDGQEKKFPCSVTSDVRIFNAFLQNSKGSVLLEDDFTDRPLEDFVGLNTRLKLAFPMEMEQRFTATKIEDVNRDMFSELISIVDDFPSARNMGYGLVPLSESNRNLLRKLGNELHTGEYAVDRSMPVNDLRTTSQTLFIKEF